MTSPNPLTVAVEALERIARMKLFPDDVINRTTLQAAIHLASNTLSQIASLSGDEREQGRSLKLPSQEWLERHVAADPDLDVEAGSSIPHASEGGEGEPPDHDADGDLTVAGLMRHLRTKNPRDAVAFQSGRMRIVAASPADQKEEGR